MNTDQNNAPMFFLTSAEAQPTLIPRKCQILERLWSDERQTNFLRISIDPPILGNPFGLEVEFIEEVIVATRHAETNLYPFSEFPITVYICYLLNLGVRNSGKVSAKDLHIILLGEIYTTLADAEKAISHEKMRI